MCWSIHLEELSSSQILEGLSLIPKHALPSSPFSSKVFKPKEPSISYICSRYYRAPELILGSTFYSTSVDIWSLGCVIAEMLLSRTLFPGSSSADQLVEIIKVLGPPTPVQLSAMNAPTTSLDKFHIHSIPKPRPFHTVRLLLLPSFYPSHPIILFSIICSYSILV